LTVDFQRMNFSVEHFLNSFHVLSALEILQKLCKLKLDILIDLSVINLDDIVLGTKGLHWI